MTYLPNLIKRIDDFSRHATALSLIKKAAGPYDDYDDYEDEPAPDYSQYNDPRYQGGQGKQIEEVTPTNRDDEGPEEGEPGEAPSEAGTTGNLVARVSQSIQDYRNPSTRDELARLASGYAVAMENPDLDFYKLELDRIRNARVSIRDNKESVDEEDEIEDAEYFLNEMEVDLQPLVGTSKGPPMERAAKEKLFATKRKEYLDTKFRGLSDSIQAIRQKEEDLEDKGITPNLYQEEGGGKDDKKPKPLMDPGGGNRNQINPAFERLTIKKCQDEIKSLEYSLQDPKNENSAEAINTLIGIIKKIISAIVTLDEAEKRVITTPDSPEEKQRETLARDNLDQLKAQRTQLKIQLREVQQRKAFEDAQSVADRTTNPDEKKWLQYHADLANLRLNPSLNKTPAVKALKNLIKATGTVVKRKEAKGLQVSYFEPLNKNKPEVETELKANFEAAQKEMVRKDEYDRKRMEELGDQQGRKKTPAYNPFNKEQNRITPGGRRIPMDSPNMPEEQKIDKENMSFKAQVYQLQIDIASAVQAARQIIYEYAFEKKKKIHTEYKDQIDLISKAIQNRNRQALYAAQNELTKLITKNNNVESYYLKEYFEIIRLQPHFSKIVETIKVLIYNSVPPKLDESGNLITENFTNEDKKALQLIVYDMYRLDLLFRNASVSEMEKRRGDKPQSEWWAMKKLTSHMRFKKVIEDMHRMQVYLALTLSIHKPKNNLLDSEYPEKNEKEKLNKARKEKLDHKKSMNFRKRVFKMVEGTNKKKENTND